MTDTSEALDILLRNARDSLDAFTQAASLARNPAFQSLFGERARERQSLVADLTKAAGVGADLADEGTAIGAANKLVTIARNTLAGGSDKGLVGDLVRREHIVVRNFSAVADDEFAPASARQFAAGALIKLMADLGQLEGLHDQFS